MKTILLTLNYWQGAGGVERVVVNMANVLVQRNYRVVILAVSPDRTSNTSYTLDSRVEKEYLPAPDTRTSSFFQALYAKVMILPSLRKLIRKHNITFVVKNELVIPPLFFRLNNVTTCTFFHSCYSYYSFSFRKRINLFGANYNIILTAKEKEKWSRLLPNIQVIPNMLIPMTCPTDQKRSKKIIAVGHLNKNKAFDRLVRSYLPLTPDFPDWELVIIGSGDEKANLETLIHAAGAQHHIKIIPPSNHIEEQYASASICAMSSFMEGFPMVLVEAMSFGVPCVAFDITTGPSDIIQQGETGFLIPDGNEEAMREALRKLMNNPALLQEMGEKAKASVDRFSEDAVMARWTSLIES